MALEKVGVVGLGTMGAGIAEVFARAGIRVIGVEADAEALARGRGHLEKSTGRALDRGRLSADERDAILGRVTLTTSRDDLHDADLVVEAIPEVLEFKVALFTELDRVCKPSTILATNTSSLSVTAIAAATGRPGRVIGMHFFNPAPVMKLVEVIGTVMTDEGVVGEISELSRRLGKTPVAVGDRAGFVVNRLLLPYLNQAADLLERGVARRDDIDAAIKLGVGLPMGPLTLLDLIGLDTSYEVMGVLFDETRSQRHAPSPILRELVTAGLLGRKSGRGFYGDDQHPADTSKGGLTGVQVLGEGAPAFAGRLAAAGFMPSATPGLVLWLGEHPMTEQAVRQADPGALVGIHLVGEHVAEVVSTVLTTPEAASAARDLMTVLGLTPVPCRDTAGFVVDALIYPYLNDAVRMHESGYASIEDIDHAMRLGCGYPAGPFEMLETIGLERVRDGLRALYAENREPAFAPAPLLDQLVTAGLRTFPRP
ncbi:3-hydroxybutyryl-CoA dehydrogenase [Nonomuraea sp. NBC_01738]|uniref:3-hydroxyacyl-CoA dehydrogenase family protein n=1 Tax=Nonomuraea sp. NBC_01738 TaxID=2976003 RepID=UPI002E1379B9|nr:3-hydroxybutyryl-CoA dehydrogenase [Nonomuraea sp. NBC_01738]